MVVVSILGSMVAPGARKNRSVTQESITSVRIWGAELKPHLGAKVKLPARAVTQSPIATRQQADGTDEPAHARTRRRPSCLVEQRGPATWASSSWDGRHGSPSSRLATERASLIIPAAPRLFNPAGSCARELNYSCGTSGFNPAGRGQSSLRVPPLASFPTSQSNEGGGARKRCRRRWSRRRPTICEFGRPSPTSKTWRRSLRRRRRRCCSWSKRVFNSAHAVRTPQFEGSSSKCSRGGEALKGWMVDQSISRSILRS